MMRDDLRGELASARGELLASMAGISPREAAIRPHESAWSIVEVLAHIIDVDDFYLGQAVAMRDAHMHQFEYFDDGAWKLSHPSPDAFDLTAVLAGMEASHSRVIEALSAMTADALAKAGAHPRGIPYAVKDIFLRIASHDRNHTQQIREIRQASALKDSGGG